MASMTASSSAGSERSIRVVVRVRPLLSNEDGHTARGVKTERGGSVALVNVRVGGRGDEQGERLSTSKCFAFDKVFGTSSSQSEVFEDSGAREMISGCLEGIHATIFAYGQTGSGKTHTMDGIEYQHALEYGGAVRVAASSTREGVSSAPTFSSLGAGLTPRSIECLFAAMQERKQRVDSAPSSMPSRRFVVHCSYVQVYKEKVYDLLNPSAIAADGTLGKGLRMRWSKRDGFFLEDLYKVSCNDVADALSALQTGARSKVMASHQLNMQSSRSHAIFTVYVATYESSIDSPEEQVVCSSKLSLVDLAGSERGATIAKNNARLFEESVFINKSLFTLRKVIQVLSKAGKGGASHGQQSSHIPYRDSKLTSLLKESLGGKATSLMIACLSSSDSFYEENLSTLEYASLAAKITNKVVVNEDPRTKLIRELRQEVDFLRMQLSTVSLLGGGQMPGADSGTPSAVDDTAVTGEAAVTIDYNALADRLDSMTADAGPGDSHEDEPLEDGERGVIKCSQREAGDPSIESGAAVAGGVDDARKRSGGEADSKIDIERLFEANKTLNTKLHSAEKIQARYVADNALLMNENASLRDKLDFLEAVVCMPDTPSGAEARADGAGAMALSEEKARQLHTASEAVMEEMLQLRKENRGLQARLKALTEAQSSDRRKASSSAALKKQQTSSNRAAAAKTLPSRGAKTVGSGSNGNNPPKINSGRLSSTGYISTALAKVAESGVVASRASPATEGAGAWTPVSGGSDENEARLSRLLQTRSAMARDHIVKQSSFHPVSK